MDEDWPQCRRCARVHHYACMGHAEQTDVDLLAISSDLIAWTCCTVENEEHVKRTSNNATQSPAEHLIRSDMPKKIQCEVIQEILNDSCN